MAAVLTVNPVKVTVLVARQIAQVCAAGVMAAAVLVPTIALLLRLVVATELLMSAA